MENVLEKVKKLLALANGSAANNQNERAAAMNRAMALLAEHNLTMSQAIEYNQRPDIEVVEEAGKESRRIEPWVRVIYDAASLLYYCGWYRTRQRKVVDGREIKTEWPVFYGTADNIAVTIEVSAWLMASIKREGHERYELNKHTRSFCMGAAIAVYATVERILAAEKSPMDTGTQGLVILRNALAQANEDFLNGIDGLGHKKLKTKVDPGEEAFQSGVEYGNQIEIERKSTKKIKRLAA